MLLYLYTHQNEVELSAHAHEQELSRAFARFDKNHDGRVLLSDLREALLTLGEPLSAKEASEMLSHAKVDDNGKIDYRGTRRTCRTFLKLACITPSGLILGLCPANERRRYNVTPSLIGWGQT